MRKFLKQKENYEDYSSGRVLYGAQGATNFPVRLIEDIFQTCNKYLTEKGSSGKRTIYDPLCGVGYSLTVLGLLHGEKLEKILASDIDKTNLEFAKKNLSLLTVPGMNRRITELQKFVENYKKKSHEEALESARRLRDQIALFNITQNIFNFDMLGEKALPSSVKNIDMVIADVPYGKLTSWQGQSDKHPVQESLDKLKSRLNKTSIVALVSNKKQEILHEGYTKIKTLKVPKRKIILLTPII
jgi:hypothetical protein